MTNTHGRKATAVLGWFPTTPATEREIIDMANSRQIALRTRLRHHYWLTDCKPLTEVAISNARRKMTLIDPQDVMTDDQVAELLTEHYGFVPLSGSKTWAIPDLDEARAAALASIEGIRARASAAGKASAAKRGFGPAAGPQLQTVAPETVPDDSDF